MSTGVIIHFLNKEVCRRCLCWSLLNGAFEIFGGPLVSIFKHHTFLILRICLHTLSRFLHPGSDFLWKLGLEFRAQLSFSFIDMKMIWDSTQSALHLSSVKYVVSTYVFLDFTSFVELHKNKPATLRWGAVRLYVRHTSAPISILTCTQWKCQHLVITTNTK